MLSEKALQVLDKAKSSLDIYARLLGDKQFIFGEK